MTLATPVLVIAGEMTIYTASDWSTRLLPLLSSAGDIAIDLSQVTEMDAAGVQLLMLAKREALRNGSRLHLKCHSQSVLDTFELCDLATYFGDPLVLFSADH
ncbi:STAS domain-containing protein (plasmid) [Pseudomonas sp. HR96]|uniref:STAS domain-containing protein n=1 Tax=Pseudomonas sp. HR96 TaxID=1027966 RepID=UPI002A763C7A|nr:STAS domain-containing protein [Pseudomonas sp. HR96]WPP02475.1 STAS domain-containing protein [Pseudomonas sp. HR96]